MKLLQLLKGVRSWLRRPAARRRKALSLALLGVCAAGSHDAGSAQESERRITISLDADDIEYSEADATAVLMGNVRLKALDIAPSLPEVGMTAERLDLSLETGQLSAPEGATFTGPYMQISGSELEYNLRQKALRALETRSEVTIPISGREVTIYGRSDRIEGSAQQIELHHTHITTCSREEPHYSIDAHRVRYKPETRRLSVHGGGFSLYGLHVPVISSISMEIREDGDVRLPLLPIVGYSDQSGFYVPYHEQLTRLDDPVLVNFDGRLTSRHLIAGSLIAEHTRPGLRTWLTLARRLEMLDDVSNKLVYDALPEVGVEVGRDDGANALTVRVLGGWYRDEDVRTGHRVRETGGTARVDWAWRDLRDDGSARLWTGAGVRGSLYGTGDSYRTLDLTAGATTHLWPRARGRFELKHHFIGGRTPFEFDDVDLKTELAAALYTPLSGPWALELGGRYDLDRGRLRDYEADLAYRHHCLTWHLEYRKVGSRLGIGLDLTDLIGDPVAWWRQPSKRRAVVGAVLAGRPLGETVAVLTGVDDRPDSPRQSVPSEYQQSGSHRQRAPGAADGLRRRPPPSLRLAYVPDFH